MAYYPSITFTESADAYFERITSHSGYERELALTYFTQHPALEVIATLPARLNDWVPQVQAAARQALAAHLRDEWRGHWLGLVTQMCTLRRKSRNDHEQWVSTFERFLMQGAAGERTLAELDAFPARAQAALFRAGLSQRPDLTDTLIAVGLQSANAVVAGDALKSLQVRASDAQVWLAMQARLAAIRLMALRWIISQRPYLRDEALREALADRSFNVFAVAVFYLKIAGFDFDAWANVAQATAERRLWLAQTGATVLPNATIESLCRHPLARVRLRALQLRLKVDPASAEVTLRDALSDPSARVQRLVLLVARLGVVPAFEEMMARLEADPQRRLFPLMNQFFQSLDAWDHLRLILRYASQYETQHQLPAGIYLANWQTWRARRIVVTPKPAQASEIAHWARGGHLAGTQLEFMLRSFGLAL